MNQMDQARVEKFRQYLGERYATLKAKQEFILAAEVLVALQAYNAMYPVRPDLFKRVPE